MHKFDPQYPRHIVHFNYYFGCTIRHCVTGPGKTNLLNQQSSLHTHTENYISPVKQTDSCDHEVQVQNV